METKALARPVKNFLDYINEVRRPSLTMGEIMDWGSGLNEKEKVTQTATSSLSSLLLAADGI